MGKKIRNLIPSLLVGFGLIFFGLAISGVIMKGNLSNEFSVTPIKVNFPAPYISLNNLAGEKITIADFNQQVVLINNWATWCPPCRDEMPYLEKFFRDHSHQGFVLIGINAGDSMGEVEAFVEEYNLSFPILLDPNKKALIAFQNDNLPSSYVINRNGTVVLAWTGPVTQAKLETYVTPLFEQ